MTGRHCLIAGVAPAIIRARSRQGSSKHCRRIAKAVPGIVNVVKAKNTLEIASAFCAAGYPVPGPSLRIRTAGVARTPIA